MNNIENSFLAFWRNQKFDNFNESDIREEFIAPLLRILGYSKNSVNDIIREKNLKLKNSYAQVGRDRIKIDYIPTIRLKKFWIIEAKPGSTRQMSYGDLLQAHLYAIHPEIQARFIVLINGWEIRVYDSHNADSWDHPLLICNQDNCETTFGNVSNFLSAKTMLSEIRKHIMSTFEESLKIEIDERVLDNLKNDLTRIINNSRPLIRANARELQKKTWIDARKTENIKIKNCSFNELLVYMNNPINAVPIYGREILRRFEASQNEELMVMANRLVMTYRGRPHSIFRVHCVDAFSRLLIGDVILDRTAYLSSTLDCLNELVEKNMNYWNSTELGSVLIHLENTIFRISKKICIRFAMKPLQKLVTDTKNILSAEDLLRDDPTVAKHMVANINLLIGFLWQKYSIFLEPDDIWKIIWQLEWLESILDKIPIQKYPDNDSDLLFFENYGKGFDMLCLGTWDVLNRNAEYLNKKQLAPQISKVLNMTRDEVIENIPKPKELPYNYELEDQLISNIAQAVEDYIKENNS